MTTITTNNRTLLFVEVPETAHHFSIEQGYLTWLNVSDSEDVLAQLPSGNYRFIATTDNAPSDLGITDPLLAEHGITGRHAIIEVLH